MLAGVLPERIQPLVIGLKSRVHGKQLDPLQAQLLVPLAKLVLPTRLRWIQRKETKPLVRVFCHAGCHVGVIDPETTEPGLAPKDHRLHLLSIGDRLAIVLVADRQVQLLAHPGSLGRLAAKVVTKMIGVFPDMAVNVNDHRFNLGALT